MVASCRVEAIAMEEWELRLREKVGDEVHRKACFVRRLPLQIPQRGCH